MRLRCGGHYHRRAHHQRCRTDLCLAVSGFVHPDKVLTNSNARPGDVLILTKPLGVGILTTAAKAEMADEKVMARIYRQMATLNKTARDIMVNYPVHSCTDVTGFGLLGHSYEMAQGSGCTLHIESDRVPYHPEALELADMGLIPAGAYRNRDYAQPGVKVCAEIPLALQDIFYDPQTSGGLLIALPAEAAGACLAEMQACIPQAGPDRLCDRMAGRIHQIGVKDERFNRCTGRGRPWPPGPSTNCASADFRCWYWRQEPLPPSGGTWLFPRRSIRAASRWKI